MHSRGVMESSVDLVFVIHNHQPVGNFDHVFQEACDRAYLPLLRTMLDFPAFRFGLHTSGSLLEWLEVHRQEYFELVREFVARGQVELLGGGMYEPILPILPPRDLKQQLVRLAHYLEEHFHVRPTGVWTPERVWEPQLVEQLAPYARYTLLDDHHFASNALPGLTESEYFRTEYLQSTMALLPINKQLRYLIPFKSAEQSLEYFGELRQRYAHPLAVFGDDGEKFGVWPDTHEWVYGQGWLREFLHMVVATQWIRSLLPAEVLDTRAPAAGTMIPARSYEEMGRWSRVDPQASADDPPGHWRNYFAKYPESHDMYLRMLQVSSAFEKSETTADPADDAAYTHLLRSQVNCAYWHGVFGGLYLNHLRHAVNRSMLLAESQLGAAATSTAAAEAGASRLPDQQTCTLMPGPADGQLTLRTPAGVAAWIDPQHGMCLRRLDDLHSCFCWSDVLARRTEH
jgi:alpha-amylase/alpha-mannosidase (GH57 family)